MASFRVLKRTLLAPVVACLLALLQAAPAQQPAVTLSFTAVDKSGQPFTALRKEDIRVLEDGVPQEVTALERRDAQPLAIILALDMSLSQEKIIPVAKQAAQHLIDTLSQERDSVGVLRVTGEAIFAQELTDNLERARGAVGGLEFKPPEGYVSGVGVVKKGVLAPAPADMVQASTAIWDAVWVASEKISAQSPATARRVIILFTDGFDTSSKRKLNEVIEGSIKARTAVYSMGVGDKYYGGVNKDDLRKISERTGGRAYFPVKDTELREVFAQLSYELGSQYVVTYSPAAARGSGEKMRKVRVEIVNPELRKQKLRLAHPQGYYTPAENRR
jgi:Ca-activated chloride channel homolog